MTIVSHVTFKFNTAGCSIMGEQPFLTQFSGYDFGVPKILHT